MMFLSGSALLCCRVARLLLLRCRMKESAGGLRPADRSCSALLQVSSSLLQCCSTTLLTAAADSANWERAREELFFLSLAGVSRGHQSSLGSELRKGCWSTSAALSLSLAVFTSSREIRSLASSEIRSQSRRGNRTCPSGCSGKG